MSPILARQSPVFLFYLALAAGLLIGGGVILAVLTWVLRANVGHAWKAYCGWLFMVPLLILGFSASLTNFGTPWFSGSRWGITGRHSIFDDRAGVIFKLESEFDYQTGEEDTPGVLFNRDAWIGFQSEELGKITFGRQNALARDFTGIYGDPYTSAPAASARMNVR